MPSRDDDKRTSVVVGIETLVRGRVYRRIDGVELNRVVCIASVDFFGVVEGRDKRAEGGHGDDG